MLEYRINKKKLPMYGIEAVCDGKIVAKADNLFKNRRKALRLAKLCNRIKLSSVHLANVAEDIIADIQKE